MKFSGGAHADDLSVVRESLDQPKSSNEKDLLLNNEENKDESK